MNSKDAMTCNEELNLESEHDWVLQPKVWLLTFDCDLHKNPLHSGAEHTSICLVTMTWKVSEKTSSLTLTWSSDLKSKMFIYTQ